MSEAIPLDEARRRLAAEAPDMSVLDGGRRAAPSMPLDMFGPWWAQWIVDQADAIAVPPEFVAYPLLSCCSALIGNSRRVQTVPGGWWEPAILWTVVLGNPASRKSAAVNIARRPLKQIEADMQEGFDEKLRDFERDKEFAKAKRDAWEADVKEAVKLDNPAPDMPETAVDPERPNLPRICVGDTTPEALQKVLHANGRGLLCWRDELSGLLESFGRYSGGRGGDRSLYIEAFAGDDHTVDRASKEPLFIKNLSVSITGGMQPDKAVSLLMQGDDDGLTARFLMTFPDPLPPNRPRGREDDSELIHAYRRLRSLRLGRDNDGNQCPVVMPLTSEALDILEAFQKDGFHLDKDAIGLYASHVGKFATFALRLALVTKLMKFAAGDEANPPTEIDAMTMGAVCDFLNDYARPMAQRIYGDAALPPAERDAAQIARRIVKEGCRTINARTIRREWRLPGLKAAEDVKEAIEVLCDAGWLTAAGTREGDTPGRKSSDFRVNPAVFGG